jgi:hypothetical protein
MTFNARMLEGLTLDAVKAKSLAQHMRLGEAKSHFNPEVPTAQRLAMLGECVGASFKYGALDRDVPRLQDSLLELAAYAATWAELLDTNQPSLDLSGVIQ